MSHRSTGSSRRLRLVAAAGALLASGIIVAAAPSGASPRSTVAPLDHFLCYSVNAPKGFTVPAGVELANAIQNAAPWTPFRPGFAKTPSWHCNPANKQVQPAVGGPLKTYKVKNPRAHQLCWGLDYQPINRPLIVSNQFGANQPLIAGSPSLLCLPTWKNRTKPPHMATDEPPKLDHFTCYTTVKADGAWTIPPLVKVEDEFSLPRYVFFKFTQPNRQPDWVCVPTIKIVKGKTYDVQSKLDLGEVCWAITTTPYWKSWYDQNQFGTGRVAPTVSSTTPELEQLCLPSTISTAPATG